MAITVSNKLVLQQAHSLVSVALAWLLGPCLKLIGAPGVLDASDGEARSLSLVCGRLSHFLKRTDYRDLNSPFCFKSTR
jgi:hypothetical protein